jgi:restriction system protein
MFDPVCSKRYDLRLESYRPGAYPVEDARVMKKSATGKLASLSPQQVQRLAAAAYRQRGYEECAITPSRVAGEGLLLIRGDQRLMLQCKHWRARKIGEMPVREFYSAMASHAATGVMLVSGGAFTREAARFAATAGIELLDAPRLQQLLQ